MQQKLELQLHEQYAINNNATLSSMLTLFVSMLAIIGGYGYVFVNSDTDCGTEFCLKAKELYTISSLLLATSATTLVLAAISYICIKSGYKGRMEQFITYAIRIKYYKTEETLQKIFPKNYNPFKEDGSWITPIQSPFDTFFYITIFTTLIINIATMIRVLCGICHSECICHSTVCLVYFQMICVLIFFWVVIYCLQNCYCKFRCRFDEYRSKLGGYGQEKIKLHTIGGGLLYLSKDEIVEVSPSEEGHSTVTTSSGKTFQIKETVKEIEELL